MYIIVGGRTLCGLNKVYFDLEGLFVLLLITPLM